MTTRMLLALSRSLNLTGSTCDGSSRPISKVSKPIFAALSISPRCSAVVKGDCQTHALTPRRIDMLVFSFADECEKRNSVEPQLPFMQRGNERKDAMTQR